MSRVIAAVVFFAVAVVGQEAEPRSPREIIRDFDRVGMPSMSAGSDEESVRKFREAIERGMTRKAELALELFSSHPDHPSVPRLMDARWACFNNTTFDHEAVVVETSMILENDAIGAELRQSALRARMRAVIFSKLSTNRDRVEAIRDLIAEHPDDEFAGMGLLDSCKGWIADPEVMRPLLELAVERWPDSGYVGKRARPWLALLDLVGESFADRLPEGPRAAFRAATAKKVPFTVVQLWSGYVWRERPDDDLSDLAAMREEFGDSVRLIGLMNENLEEKLPEVRKAGYDWPQIEARGEKPWVSPLGVGPGSCYFVLDQDLRVIGVVGRARSAALRIRQVAH